MLTPAQRKRLAKEARKLAMEIVEGRAGPFNNESYACCAIGEVAVRTGINSSRKQTGDNETRAGRIEETAFGVRWSGDQNALVSNGLRYLNPDGAVFPLLALADALEEA